jgi:hypothetical protein
MFGFAVALLSGSWKCDMPGYYLNRYHSLRATCLSVRAIGYLKPKWSRRAHRRSIIALDAIRIAIDTQQEP